jgi:exodeoxyribonuclease-3
MDSIRVIGGDWNVTASLYDVGKPDLWEGKISCSLEERKWFQNFRNYSGFLDPAAPIFSGKVDHLTWWDYKSYVQMDKRKGLRLDSILIDAYQSIKVLEWGVDTNFRDAIRPSDHAPVWIKIRI